MTAPTAHTPARLQCALGPGIDEFRSRFQQEFLPKHFPAWTRLEPEPMSTDALAEAFEHATTPWDVLLVTDRLTGHLSLTQVIARIRVQWPACHCVVLLRRITPAAQTLAANLASYQVYNLGWDQMSSEMIIRLLTEVMPWEHIRPLLPTGTAADITRQDFPAAPGASAKSGRLRVPVRPSATPTAPHTAPPSPQAHATIAVVAARSGVGKSGWLANMAVASPSWQSVIVDADPWHPGLWTYFRDPAFQDDTPTHWQAVLASLSDRTPDTLDAVGWPEAWSDAQRAVIRQYVYDAVTLRPGVLGVPGASRRHPTPVPYVPHWLDAVVADTYAMGQLTWIDTATLPDDRYLRDACRLADHIVVVVTPQYPVITETLRWLDTMERLGTPRTKLSWVVLRADHGGYSVQDLTRIHLANWTYLGAWPDDPSAWETALQQHRLLAETQPQRWRQALAQLVGPAPDELPTHARKSARWRPFRKT